jgi:uncharacterized protein (TIGR03067 family)
MTSLLLGLALVAAAPAPKKGEEPPPAKLEGDWVVEAFDGPKDEAPPGTITFRFVDGRISIMDASRKGKQEDAGYTADLTKMPATIDITPNKGADKVVQGIIEIKGDTMKLCFGRDGTDRPKEFKGDREKGVMMITLKRVKSEK